MRAECVDLSTGRRYPRGEGEWGPGELENRKHKIFVLLKAIREGVFPRESVPRKFASALESVPDGLDQDGLIEQLARSYEGRIPKVALEYRPQLEATPQKPYPKYGLSAQDMILLERHSGGRCGGCGRDFTSDRAGRAVIDHCHERGYGNRNAVRGLLCQMCNIALSKHMTPETLRALAEYLERFESSPDPPWTNCAYGER